MREANHFVAAGLVGERRQGNLRFVRARTDNVVAGPLAELLAPDLRATGGARFGSRSTGGLRVWVLGGTVSRAGGDMPCDLDVLWWTTPTMTTCSTSHAPRIEPSAGRSTYAGYRRRPWHASVSDPFVRSLRLDPLVELELSA